jgi:hypothetical protein
LQLRIKDVDFAHPSWLQAQRVWNCRMHWSASTCRPAATSVRCRTCWGMPMWRPR